MIKHEWSVSVIIISIIVCTQYDKKILNFQLEKYKEIC